MQETPEQRSECEPAPNGATREGRLAGGEDVLPHVEISENCILTDTKELLEKGSMDFSIRENIAHVQIVQNFPDACLFSVSVNGINLEVRLICMNTGNSNQKFMFQVPEPLQREFGESFIFEKNPYIALFKVIGARSFQAYLESLTRQRAAEAVRREQERTDEEASREKITKRIIEEAQRFRIVLVRKYRQLTYVDEYETRELDRFLEEVKRFVKKRLPDADSQSAILWAVEVIAVLVPVWAAEEDARSDDAKFDASMSPTDYERFCADRFAAAGWNVRLTKGSGDQGADIICDTNGRRLVVQCKLYSGSVGNAAVQEVIAAREFEYANSAAVVSNASYTTTARELASTARVHLLHHDEICNVKP